MMSIPLAPGLSVYHHAMFNPGAHGRFLHAHERRTRATQHLTTLVLLAWLLACFATPAAGTVINHCISATGTPVFTDQPCSNLDALPAPDGHPAQSNAAHRGPRLCAHDDAMLRKHVAAAFVNDDVNALAGLILWHDYRERSAVRVLHQLSALLRQPFLGFANAPAQGPPDPTSGLPSRADMTPEQGTSAAASIDTLRVRLAGEPPSLAAFPVIRRAGCLWLEPPEIVPQGDVGSILSTTHAVR